MAHQGFPSACSLLDHREIPSAIVAANDWVLPDLVTGHRLVLGNADVRRSGPTASRAAATSTHPFDVVGWDGCLYPYTFNIDDDEPITGRIHQPPPVHQVFEGHNFVICNFVPRKVDEVMFHCGGDYAARKGSGIGQGSISLHPGGHAHGPQPGAYERSIGAGFFDELAMVVDTFAPTGAR